MYYKTIAAALLAASTVAATAGQTPAPPITVDSDFAEYALTWRGLADRADVRFTMFNHEGQIYVCGSYALSGHSNKRLNLQALRDLELRMDRTTLMADFTNFTRVSSKSKLVGSKANCFASGVAAPKDARRHKFEIHSKKDTYQD